MAKATEIDGTVPDGLKLEALENVKARNRKITDRLKAELDNLRKVADEWLDLSKQKDAESEASDEN